MPAKTPDNPNVDTLSFSSAENFRFSATIRQGVSKWNNFPLYIYQPTDQSSVFEMHLGENKEEKNMWRENKV